MIEPLTADEMSDLLTIRDEIRFDSQRGDEDQTQLLTSLGRAVDFCATPENLVRVSSEDSAPAARLGPTVGRMRTGVEQMPRGQGPVEFVCRECGRSCPHRGTCESCQGLC